MKLTCIRDCPSAPCYLLRLRKALILVDYGLDHDSNSKFVPQSPKHVDWKVWSEKDRATCRVVECDKVMFLEGRPMYSAATLEDVEIGDIHAVLVTSPQGMLGLPFLTESPGFTARVYATEAALQVGRMCISELLTLEAQNWAIASAPAPAAAAHEFLQAEGSAMRALYTEAQALASMGRVIPLRYGQQVLVAGGTLEATPKPCGGGLGSCLWVLRGEGCRAVLIGPEGSLKQGPFAEMELPDLAGADVMVMACTPDDQAAGSLEGLGGATHVRAAGGPDIIQAEQLPALMTTLVASLRSGGSALVPVHPDGPALQIIEAVGKVLVDSGLGQVPLYYVSPAATELLAYASTSTEWLCESRQKKAYVPEMPFGHAQMQRDGRLVPAASLSAPPLQAVWKEPCVAFVPALSLTFGPTRQLMERWRGSDRCVLCITQQSLAAAREILAIWRPMAMRVVYCDARGLFSNDVAAEVLSQATPSHLLVPRRSLSAIHSMPAEKRLQLSGDVSTVCFACGMTVQVTLPKEDRLALMDAELSVQIHPGAVQVPRGVGGVKAARVVAFLSLEEMGWVLDAPQEMSEGAVAAMQGVQQRRCVWGQPRITQLMSKLGEVGLSSVQVERGDQGGKRRKLLEEGSMDTVSLVVPGGAIHLAPNATHIEADDAVMRDKLLTAVRSLLKVL